MNVAIIAAGGRGARLGGKQAKQFRALGGTPIIVHTLRRFEHAASIGEVVIVLPPDEVASFVNLSTKYNLRKLARVVPGGDSRGESICKGLQTLRTATAGVVAIHDGVRPFVTAAEIDETVRKAEEVGAAVLAAPAVDTIKEIDKDFIVRTLRRENLRHALTPQCFRYDILRRAYEEARRDDGVAGATDDSALVEKLGVRVAVVNGDPRNIKITRPQDLVLAEQLLREFGENGWA